MSDAQVSDAELLALTALANAEVAGMVWENEQRKNQGFAMAYGDNDFWHTSSVEALREALRKRGHSQ